MPARLVALRRTAALLLGLGAAACADVASEKKAGGADAAILACVDPAFCESVCQLDRDCPIGELCQDGRCRTTPALPDMGGSTACMRNGDCPDGFGCDAQTRTCVPEARPDRACDDVRDCFAGEICIDDYCRPEPDAALVEPDAALVEPDAALPPVPDAAPPPVPDAALPPPPDAFVPPPPVPDAVVVVTPDAALPPEPDAALPPEPDAFVPPPEPDAFVPPPEPDAFVPPPEPDAALPPEPDAFVPPEPDAAPPPPPDAFIPPPDAAPPEPDAFVPPPTPPRGVYEYGRIPLGGAEELRAVEFHPDGSYAVVLQRTNVVHVLDWATQTAVRYDLRPAPNDNIYWDDVAFDPSGGFAYAVGTRISAAAREGVIYRFDDAVYRQRDANMQVPLVQVQRVAGQEFTGIEYPWQGGNPVVLAKSAQSGPNAFLRDLDPATDAFGDFVVAQPMGFGCEDLAFVNNEFGEPGILVVGGTNGAGFFFYTEVAGIGEVRVNPGSNNVGNLFSVSGHPLGDYALTLNGGNAHLRRFEGALMNDSADGPWFQTQNISAVRFQQEGQRALIFGGAFGSPMRAYVIEYRHDLYRCPQPFGNCDLTDVSVPNFNAPPFSAVANTHLNDAAFRPGCDGGVLVGGFTDFRSSSAQLVKFQILGARACGP